MSDDFLSLILPWPARNLSPNARVHWAEKHKASKVAKEQGFYIAREAISDIYDFKGEGWNTDKRRYMAVRLFHPKPDKKKRDEDNFVASLKPYQDGIFKALGLDDSRVKVTLNVMATPNEKPYVEFLVLPFSMSSLERVFRYVGDFL